MVRMSSLIALALVGVSCGFFGGSMIRATIRNQTSLPVEVALVEFDFERGEALRVIEAVTTIAADGQVDVQFEEPSEPRWALLVNGIPAITAIERAQEEEGIAGAGPLLTTITVDESGLQKQVNRASTDAGQSEAP